MYKVSSVQHEQYGNVVTIDHSDEGIETPFFAVQQALKNRRLWKENGAKNIKFLIDNKVMTPKQMESWYHEEYQSLPKCAWCVKILGSEVFTHRLCGSDLFCAQGCANQDYHEKTERLKDEEAIDYL